MGVHFYSYTTHNMKTACFIVLALVAVSQAQLGGWNDMDCGKNSMCAKRFNKFMVPKISDHLAHDKCEWKFCHVQSGKYQIVNGMNLDITGFVMAMNPGCDHATGYVKCNVQAHKQGKSLKSIDFNCQNKPMSEMPMMKNEKKKIKKKKKNPPKKKKKKKKKS